jgi:hypothetical protein
MQHLQRSTWTTNPAHILLAVAALASLSLACATRYSPSRVREEIARQRGVDPRSAFELNLGRLTTSLLKSAFTTEGGEVPFAGLDELQLAVYEVPEREGPAIDVTLFGARGWEPTIRAHDERRSIVILVRASRASPGMDEVKIGDLVVVGASRRKVVYGRLRGTLDPELPSRLGEMFEDGGPEKITDAFSALEDSASSR